MENRSDLFLTKKRLTEWGNWCYQVTTMGLDYARQSIIAKLQAEGGMIIHGTAKVLFPTNQQAETVNDLIERLAEQKPTGAGKPLWAKVIRIHYTMPNKDIKTRIVFAELNERTYYRYLRDAQNWLIDHLS